MLPLLSASLEPVIPNPEIGGRPRAQATRWICILLYILYVLIFGIPLLFLPWSNSWENNYLLFLCPQIKPVVSNPFFKGAVLGLGIANILIGIREVVHCKWMSKSCLTR